MLIVAKHTCLEVAIAFIMASIIASIIAYIIVSKVTLIGGRYIYNHVFLLYRLIEVPDSPLFFIYIY